MPLPKTADKPIRCLKVVRKITTLPSNPNKPTSVEYVPPIRDYYGFRYYVGETARMGGLSFDNRPSKENTLQAENTIPWMIWRNYDYEVNHGLHTYCPDSQGARFLQSALKEQIDRVELEGTFDTERRDVWTEPAILECEIPVGAHYYEGISEESDSVDTRGYASDRLTVLRELSKEEVEKLPAPPAHRS